MKPIIPVNQPLKTIQQSSSLVNETDKPEFGASIAEASSRIEQSSEQWELGANVHDQYLQGLQNLLNDALVDQSFENTRVAILISTLAIERMRSDPEFESRILNSLYEGMHAALYLVIPAYLILKVQSDGTVESASGDKESMPEFEEETVNAFWVRQPVNATLSSTDAWHMPHAPKPKPHRKLNRKRIMIWLERRRQQF